MEGSRDVVILRADRRWSLQDFAGLAQPPLAAAGAEQAVAFGAYARGTADGYSDLDLAVVLPPDPPFVARAGLLRDEAHVHRAHRSEAARAPDLDHETALVHVGHAAADGQPGLVGLLDGLTARRTGAELEAELDHPVAEAENCIVDVDGSVVAMGKHLDGAGLPDHTFGEFIGLMKFSATGAQRFREAFDALNASLSPDAPFQKAAEWRKAYLTDMFQELVDQGERVDAATIQRGWAELDTAEDYARLASVAERQRLETIVRFNRNCSA